MMDLSKNRLEAFSDGVMAILITIMVLELRAPEQAELAALKPLLPVIFRYALSFVYLAIYWNNHHHLLHATKRINGAIMWANMHLLFWLSLFPFVTAWLGQAHGGAWPTVMYGLVFFMAAVAYFILQCCIVSLQGKDSALSAALGSDWKGKLSPVLYVVAIGLAFVNPWFSDAIYIFVAMLWIIPDRRIEKI
jgi:uncharacterized membrane protein